MRSPPTFGKVTITTPPHLANRERHPAMPLGKISQADLGMALWTARGGFDLIGGGAPTERGARQHEFDHHRQERAACGRSVGAERAPALDDLYGLVGLRRRAAVALRPDPSDGGLGPHLHFQPDRG